jgi:hypothetical protein
MSSSSSKLVQGDEVVCNIRDNDIVSSYSEFDSQETFAIIAVDGHGYFLYIPQYIHVKDCNEITAYFAGTLGIHRKYIGEQTVYIKPGNIVRVHRNIDGYVCNKCGEYYPMSQSNQEDGTFICWVCRTYHTYD